MKKSILHFFVMCLLPFIIFSQDFHDWRPFLQAGKTWSYKISFGDIEKSESFYAQFKIEESVMHDGKEYFPCRIFTTYPEAESFDTPFCYLRENCYGDVKCILNPDFPKTFPLTYIRALSDDPYDEGYYIFSSSDPLISTEFVRSVIDLPTVKLSEVNLETPMGEKLKGYDIQGENLSGIKIWLYEGIGYIYEKNPYFFTTFITSSIEIPGYEFYIPELYEVKEGDGTVLYHDSQYAPQGGVEYVNLADDETESEYIDLQGRTVAEPTGGVYLRRQGPSVTKELIR